MVNSFMNDYYRDGFMFLAILISISSNLPSVIQLNTLVGWVAWWVSFGLLVAFSVGFIATGFYYNLKNKKTITVEKEAN